MNRTLVIAGLAAGVFCGVAAAQPGVTAPPKATPAPVVAQPPTRPTYDSLVKRDAAGKIIRLNGCLDALALQRNPLLDEKARYEMGPVISEWIADVNQTVIDNLDFVEKIDGGLFDSYDMNDAVALKYIQQINTQLQSPGPLTARLAQRNLLPGASGGMNMQISNEYIQSVFNEINAAPAKEGEAEQVKQARNANSVGRYFTSLTGRDAYEQYRCMLRDSAGLLDKVLPALPEGARKKAEGKVSAVGSAGDDAAKMVAVRDLLAQLSFDERRAFLTKAVSLGAASDVFKPAPEIPHPTVAPSKPGA